MDETTLKTYSGMDADGDKKLHYSGGDKMIAFIFGMLAGAFLGTYASAWMNAYRE